MQKYFWTAIFVFMIVASALYAKDKSPQSSAFVQGTVLSVQKEDVQSPQYMGGTNPSDAPLQSSYYAYNVSIHVGCETYVGRYETPFDYFPSALSPNHSVDVRLTKHVMYFNVPGENDMKMPIVHYTNDAAGCGRGN